MGNTATQTGPTAGGSLGMGQGSGQPSPGGAMGQVPPTGPSMPPGGPSPGMGQVGTNPLTAGPQGASGMPQPGMGQFPTNPNMGGPAMQPPMHSSGPVMGGNAMLGHSQGPAMGTGSTQAPRQMAGK